MKRGRNTSRRIMKKHRESARGGLAGRFPVLLLAAGLLLLAGCRAQRNQPEADQKPSGEMPEEITIMHADAGKKEFQDFISETEQKLNMKIHIRECPINADSRHAKISLLLSSGDSSVDIISVNDEMLSEFKWTGCLEPLTEDVMDRETASWFPQDYLKQMAVADGEIYSVPYMMDVLVLWVNASYLREVGLPDISTRERFFNFLSHDWGEGRYSYGGAWEKSYVYNEIGAMIHLFGGDYYDWKHEKTREAASFLKSCADRGYAPKDLLLDQYEQENQKFIDGKYGMILTYSGAMNTFADAGVYGPDQIHVTGLPQLGGNTTYIATWQYVLNKSSRNKEAAKRFLSYAASREGSIAYAEHLNRMPARQDAAFWEDLHVTGCEEIRGYLKDVKLEARPLTPDSIDYISQVGTLFQRFVTGEASLEDYCREMQRLVDKNKN